MNTATSAVALSTAPGELSFTRFSTQLAARTTTKKRNAHRDESVRIAETQSVRSATNTVTTHNRRVNIEMGWPLES